MMSFFLNSCWLGRCFKWPSSAWYRSLENLKLCWNCVILVTWTAKFIMRDDQYYPSSAVSLQANTTAGFDWSELVLLNYLPRINQINRFSTLFPSLMICTTGTTLLWRLYLRFHDTTIKGQFDAKHELLSFFMNGPVDKANEDQRQLRTSIPRQASLEPSNDASLNREGTGIRRRRGRRVGLLTRAHIALVSKSRQSPFNTSGSQLEAQTSYTTGAWLAGAIWPGESTHLLQQPH